jgi:hypothetical protein
VPPLLDVDLKEIAQVIQRWRGGAEGGDQRHRESEDQGAQPLASTIDAEGAAPVLIVNSENLNFVAQLYGVPEPRRVSGTIRPAFLPYMNIPMPMTPNSSETINTLESMV